MQELTSEALGNLGLLSALSCAVCSICLCWGLSRLAVLRSRARSRDTSVSCFAPSLFLWLGSCFCAIPFCCLLCCIKDGLISGAVPSKHSGDPRNFTSSQRLYLHFPSFSECSHFHRNTSLPPNYSPVSPLFFPSHLSPLSLFACFEAEEKTPRRDETPCVAVLLGCSSAVPVLSEPEKVAITIL